MKGREILVQFRGEWVTCEQIRKIAATEGVTLEAKIIYRRIKLIGKTVITKDAEKILLKPISGKEQYTIIPDCMMVSLRTISDELMLNRKELGLQVKASGRKAFTISELEMMSVKKETEKKPVSVKKTKPIMSIHDVDWQPSMAEKAMLRF